MPDSSDSSSSWPGFLSELNKTFGLIRDVFGYALPGGVFLAIAVMAKRAGHGGFSLSDVKTAVPFHIPAWLAFLALLAACYAIGDVLAAIAYMPVGLMKWFQWLPLKRFFYADETVFKAWLDEKYTEEGPNKGKDKGHRTRYARYNDNPTEVTDDLLAIRLRHPEFFLTLDRRETLELMSGSMCIALLGGWLIFYIGEWRAITVLPIAGIILLIQFLTGLSHLRRVRRAIRSADKMVPSDTDSGGDLKSVLQQLTNALSPRLQDLLAAASPKLQQLVNELKPAVQALIDAANAAAEKLKV